MFKAKGYQQLMRSAEDGVFLVLHIVCDTTLFIHQRDDKSNNTTADDKLSAMLIGHKVTVNHIRAITCNG